MKRDLQAFSARVVRNLLQSLLDYGDEFKCVLAQNRSHLAQNCSTQQHSVSTLSHHHLRHHHRLHYHLIRLLRLFTLVPSRCEGATTNNFPLLFSRLRSFSSFPPLALLFSSFTPLSLIMLCFSHSMCYCFNVCRLQLYDGMRQHIFTLLSSSV